MKLVLPLITKFLFKLDAWTIKYGIQRWMICVDIICFVNNQKKRSKDTWKLNRNFLDQNNEMCLSPISLVCDLSPASHRWYFFSYTRILFPIRNIIIIGSFICINILNLGQEVEKYVNQKTVCSRFSMLSRRIANCKFLEWFSYFFQEKKEARKKDLDSWSVSFQFSFFFFVCEFLYIKYYQMCKASWRSKLNFYIFPQPLPLDTWSKPFWLPGLCFMQLYLYNATSHPPHTTTPKKGELCLVYHVN